VGTDANGGSLLGLALAANRDAGPMLDEILTAIRSAPGNAGAAQFIVQIYLNARDDAWEKVVHQMPAALEFAMGPPFTEARLKSEFDRAGDMKSFLPKERQKLLKQIINPPKTPPKTKGGLVA
jgi:hypothetical protein